MTKSLTSSSPTIFKGRHLYSRYAPQKIILSIVESLDVREHTLVLAFSPALCYGLPELASKLSDGSHILCIEGDEDLYAVARDALAGIIAANPVFASKITLIAPRDISSCIPGRITTLGTFRRAIRVDLSGGVAFNPSLYSRIEKTVDAAIARYWQNRITLTRLGRLYAKNIFRNLLQDRAEGNSAALPLRSVDRPILVAGAGPSLDAVNAAGDFAGYYVIAVDAAAAALAFRGIRVDMVVQLESQQAIDDAWVGMKAAFSGPSPPDVKSSPLAVKARSSPPDVKSFPLAALDLTARSAGARQSGAPIARFCTRYAEASFLDRLFAAETLREVPPLGSVGLAAVFLAISCRVSSEVPVYVTGLDFSYPPGFTHARGTPQHRSALNRWTRLAPPFAMGSETRVGKNGDVTTTDPVLRGYRDSFQDYFGKTENLYDAGSCGLPLGIPASGETLRGERRKDTGGKSAKSGRNAAGGISGGFLRSEKAGLTELRDILTGTLRENPNRVYELLREREYLFLHFPDGYDFTGEKAADLHFLKRVRSEIDGFLKIVNPTTLSRPGCLEGSAEKKRKSHYKKRDPGDHE